MLKEEHAYFEKKIQKEEPPLCASMETRNIFYCIGTYQRPASNANYRCYQHWSSLIQGSIATCSLRQMPVTAVGNAVRHWCKGRLKVLQSPPPHATLLPTPTTSTARYVNH
jgi:hypothetical protein